MKKSERHKALIAEIEKLLKECEDTELLRIIYLLLLKN